MSVVAQVVKKFINDPDNVVPEALAGVAAAHPGLVRVDLENQLVLRADAPVQGKVGLVSGGGSGHEPLHGGFVGTGMLDAACAGAVFTSPTPDGVQAAISATTGDAGALLLVKNYTGDVLNFETAAELASAEGLDVRTVVIDDGETANASARIECLPHVADHALQSSPRPSPTGVPARSAPSPLFPHSRALAERTASRRRRAQLCACAGARLQR